MEHYSYISISFTKLFYKSIQIAGFKWNFPQQQKLASSKMSNSTQKMRCVNVILIEQVLFLKNLSESLQNTPGNLFMH